MYVGTDFSEVNPGETIPLTLDFVNDVASGIIISSVGWSSGVVTGFDPNGTSIATGSPLKDGTKTTQFFHSFLAGVKYRVTATATMSDGSIMILYSHVPCRSQA
jgi:hypothetical protein